MKPWFEHKREEEQNRGRGTDSGRSRTRELWPSGGKRPGGGASWRREYLGILCRSNRNDIFPLASFSFLSLA